MPEPRFGRILRGLLPRRIADDLFDPAWEDLRAEHLTREMHASSSARTGLAFLYRLIAIGLFFDCLRLGALDFLTQPRAEQPAPRRKVQTLSWKERIQMFFYLVRHALRQLRLDPTFTVTALLTLALGVGMNVAVFAVVDAVLLRPLPYPDADELVVLNHRDRGTGITKEFIAMGDFVDFAARQSSFEAISAYGRGRTSVVQDEDAYRVEVLTAGPGFLDQLRIRPVLGRTLVPGDALEDSPPVVMLSHETWQTRFGGDPGIVGRTVKFETSERQIVGVAPPGFTFPPTATTDMILPLKIPTQTPTARKSDWTFGLGRLKKGVTLQRASADLERISRQLETEFLASNQGSEYFPTSLRATLVGNTGPALVLLSGAVGIVLLIACANVANLMLARALGRRREMSIRMALGAGGMRLAAQLLTESLVLSAFAAGIGVFAAHWGTRALVALLPESGNVPGLHDVHINGIVLGFTVAIVFLTTMTFGLISALMMRSQRALGALTMARGTSLSTRGRRATSVLVVAEVALAIVLLVGAGLILRSFAGLLDVDPGFRTANVMTMNVQLPGSRYQEAATRDQFYGEAFRKLRAIPGVRDVGVAVVVPLTGNNWTAPFERADQPAPPGTRPPDVGWQVASGGYFSALQIPLLGGRLFDERDTGDAPPVVIISEAIQARFFHGQSAVGMKVNSNDGLAEIVGVVGNIRRAGLRDEPRADMYYPFERNRGGQMTFFVSTASAPDDLTPTLRSTIKAIEPRVNISDEQTLAHIAAESERVTRALLWLLGAFAVTALALAAIGIYGVMSYAVRQRTREIGTRMALGATRRDILRLVIRQGGGIAIFGTLLGLLAGLVTTRFLASLLYGVTGWDPLTMAGAVAVLSIAIGVACWVPARRAASIDPARTLAEQ